MKKRTKRVKRDNHKSFFLVLSIAVFLIALGIFIRYHKINGYTYVETDTYENSYWTCPDGTQSEEASCKTYSYLLSEAQTFCEAHCHYLSDNIKQCNPDFHRGRLCSDTGSSDISDTPSLSDPVVDVPSDYGHETPQDVVICHDSDNSDFYDIDPSLMVKGTCTDSTGSYSDFTISPGIIREFWCDDNLCTSLPMNCTSADWDYSQNGECVERYVAQGVTHYGNDSYNNTNQSYDTPVPNYTYHNPNSEAYSPPITNYTGNPLCNDGECYFVGRCFKSGERYKTMYCYNGELKLQSNVDESCTEDIQCMGGKCLDGKCSASPNFIQKILEFIKGIF